MILLAAIGARTGRNGVALALAVAGVYLLTDVQLAGEPVGLCSPSPTPVSALYIVLAHRVAQHGAMAGIDGLAAAMLIAWVVAMPLGGGRAPALGDPVVLLAGIGVGVTSSVIPYVCDQLAMARMPRATYALLVSLLPRDGDGGRDRRPRVDPRRRPRSRASHSSSGASPSIAPRSADRDPIIRPWSRSWPAVLPHGDLSRRRGRRGRFRSRGEPVPLGFRGRDSGRGRACDARRAAAPGRLTTARAGRPVRS